MIAKKNLEIKTENLKICVFLFNSLWIKSQTIFLKSQLKKVGQISTDLPRTPQKWLFTKILNRNNKRNLICWSYKAGFHLRIEEKNFKNLYFLSFSMENKILQSFYLPFLHNNFSLLISKHAELFCHWNDINLIL